MSRRLNPGLQAVLTLFRSQLSQHFGPRLLDLILFGSHARGDAGADSDVDVAVVLDRINSHSERVWPMQLAGELEGILLVPIVLSNGQLEHLRKRR